MALGDVGGAGYQFVDNFGPKRQPPAGYTTDPNTGRYIPIVGSGADVLQQRDRQQKLEDEARQRTLTWETSDRNARDELRTKLVGMLDRPIETGYMAGYSGGGGPGPTDFAVPPEIGSIQLPDTSAAQANIFARAKDQVGQETAGSLASLRSALAGRGMLGGGAEVRGAQNILTAGQGQLGDTTREQAIQEGNRLTDFAKLGYEGAIQQRGQDISARGQDISARNAAADRAQRAAEFNANANRTRYEGVSNLLGKLY